MIINRKICLLCTCESFVFFNFIFKTLFIFFLSPPPHAISSPCKALLSFSRKFGHLVIWSFCRFSCLIIGFVAYLLKIGGNGSRRRTISFSSYSDRSFPLLLYWFCLSRSFSGLFLLPFSFSFSFCPSFYLSIFIPPTNLQPSCGRG